MVVHLLAQRFQLLLCHCLIAVAAVIVRTALAGSAPPERLLIEMDLVVRYLPEQDPAGLAVADHQGGILPVGPLAGRSVPHPQLVAVRHRLVGRVRIDLPAPGFRHVTDPFV